MHLILLLAQKKALLQNPSFAILPIHGPYGFLNQDKKLYQYLDAHQVDVPIEKHFLFVLLLSGQVFLNFFLKAK